MEPERLYLIVKGSQKGLADMSRGIKNYVLVDETETEWKAIPRENPAAGVLTFSKSIYRRLPSRHPVMKCGHAASATNEHGDPCCVTCIGILPGADEIMDEQPELTGREAECEYCHRKVPSNYDLAFFGSRPTKATDEFYCGCRGWS